MADSASSGNTVTSFWAYKSSILWLILIVLSEQLFSNVMGDKNIYFDKYGHCQKIEPFDLTFDDFVLMSAGSGDFNYNSLNCKVTLQAPAESGICLNFDEFYIEDCGVQLNIYEASSTTGLPWSSLECNDRVPDEMCTDGHLVTLELLRDHLSPDRKYSFKIKVRQVSEDNLDEKKTAKSLIRIAVIVAISVGVVAVLAIIPVVVCCCCRRTSGQGKQRRISESENALLELAGSIPAESPLSVESYIQYVRRQSRVSGIESIAPIVPYIDDDNSSTSVQSLPSHSNGQKKRSVSFSLDE